MPAAPAPRATVVASVFALLTGCAGISQIRDTVTKFDQSTHTVSSAEMAFLHAGQALDCNYLFYTSAFEFAQDPSPEPSPSLVTAAQCQPNLLTDYDLQIRQKLFDAISLYADQLQAIASGGADKTLSSEGQTAASNFNKLLENQNVLKGAKNTTLSADVEAAVVALFSMAVSAKELRAVKDAAAAESANLCEVVRTLQSENAQLAIDMISQAGTISKEFDTSISFLKENGWLVLTKGPPDQAAKTKPLSASSDLARENNYEVFFYAVQARAIVQGLGSLGITGKSDSRTAASCTVPPVKAQPTGSGTAQQLNSALEALLATNSAIANPSDTGALTAAISDLVARAQAAQSMAATLAK
jgi:hypothetical protein